MVAIKVDEKDSGRVFSLLINGKYKFSEFKDNVYRLDEEAEKVLELIDENGITYRKL